MAINRDIEMLKKYNENNPFKTKREFQKYIRENKFENVTALDSNYDQIKNKVKTV